MNFADFHFLRPYWLLALIPLTGFLYAYYHRRLKQGIWSEVCDSQLLKWLLVDKPGKRQSHPLSWMTLGGAIAVLSLAGPSWERIPVPVFRNQSALVIVLDLSESMYANDLKPNRIAHARFKIIDILKQRKDGQSALIAYSDAAFVVTPLSSDSETIIHQLSVLEPSLMPGKGNNTKIALKTASRLLKQAGISNGQVLLVTDSGDKSKAVKAAKQLSRQGHQLFILGVGTEAGAPIPQPGGFVQGVNGSIVIPQLDTADLKKMAAAGQGIYQANTSNNNDIKQLLDAIEKSASTDITEKSVSEISLWKDQGPWLALLLIPFAALIFRKGYIAVVLITVIGISPESHAFNWDDLWRNPDQRGQQAFKKNQYDVAAKHFNSPQWKAASEYRAGHYDKAAEILKQLPPTSDNLYNLGNTQASLSQLEDALKSYQQALEKDLQNTDAQHNKKLVEQAIKQQKKQKQEQQNKDKSNDDSEQEQNQKNQQDKQDQQQSDDSEQQNKDQQQSDSKSEQNQEKDQESSSNNAEQDQDKIEDTTEQHNKPEPGNDEEDKEQEQQAMQADDEQPLNESDQATEQWLRRIPDDPGRLLRRKFQYQYNRRKR
ncbi:MAG: VWA domain-containing protein [Methylococcales bacterium]